MAGPTEQLIKDTQAKRASRLGGQRTTDMLPEQDVGYIEYEGQSPDLSNPVASYDQPAMATGFADSAPQESLFPEPQESPFKQASLTPETQGEVTEAGCPGGNCAFGSAPQAVAKMVGSPEPAAEGEAEAKPAGPDFSLMSNIPVTTIDIPSPVTGEIVSSIPVLDVTGLQKFSDAMNQKAAAAAAAQNYPEFIRTSSMAKMAFSQIQQSQSVSAAAAALITNLHAERQTMEALQPDFMMNQKMELFSNPNISPRDAAAEATRLELAEMTQAAGEAVEQIPKAYYQETLAANTNKAFAVSLGMLAGSMSSATGENANQVKAVAKEAMITNLIDYYNPYVADLKAQGQDPYDRSIMNSVLRSGLARDIEVTERQRLIAAGQNESQARLMAAGMTNNLMSAFTNELFDAYQKNRAFDGENLSPTEVVTRKAVEAADNAAMTVEQAMGGFSEGMSNLFQTGANAANNYITKPIDSGVSSFQNWWNSSPQPADSER